MKELKRQKLQMSETLLINIILAVSGGSMDAYSYLCREHVFANAQTGNILLFGINLSEGNVDTALMYLWPVLAFTAGIVLSDIIRAVIKNELIHWRQAALAAEIVLLFAVCFIPQSHNIAANAMISFACGIQVETFRKTRGNGIATTMCIGNLRSGTYNLDKYIQTRQKEYIKKAGVYYGIIFSFISGAVIEGRLIKLFSEKALYFSVGLLIAAFVLMFIEEKEFGEYTEI